MARELSGTINSLVQSLANTTLKSYQNSWKKFDQFLVTLDLDPSTSNIPISSQMVALFVAHLFNLNHRAPTIRTHLSAIAYSHRIRDLPSPTDSFLIQKMLRGAEVQAPGGDARLPVTLPVLKMLINVISTVANTYYERCLFAAICCTAFYAFLRSSEFCDTPHCLQLHQLYVEQDLSFMSITFLSYKHMRGNQPFIIKILAKDNVGLCPVRLMSQYLLARGGKAGPLFAQVDCSPISRSHFTRRLNFFLRACGLNTLHYKAHSFRIGAATHALLQGKSDSEIEFLGRWASASFKKYLRVAGLVSV